MLAPLLSPPGREQISPRGGLVATGDLTSLFAGLETAETLLLAVSGGADSMALLHLAAGWANRLASPPTLHVATVDHGLRVESERDCALVSEAAATLGLPCVTLAWLGPKPATRRQESARTARYALLVAHARAVGATHLLTAHHGDDQAETVLMRLSRGSGLTGLAGMRRDTALAPGLTLVRPLLDLPKCDLIAICRRATQTFVEDPSNLDPAYARTRLRSQVAMLERLGLDREGLGRLARRMARADSALEAETDRVERDLTPVPDPSGYRTGPMPAVADEILLRLLRRAVTKTAGGDRAIRLDRLEALGDALQAALRDGRPLRATLAGTRITLSRDRMLDVTPEPPRRRGRAPSLRPN